MCAHAPTQPHTQPHTHKHTYTYTYTHLSVERKRGKMRVHKRINIQTYTYHLNVLESRKPCTRAPTQTHPHSHTKNTKANTHTHEHKHLSVERDQELCVRKHTHTHTHSHKHTTHTPEHNPRINFIPTGLKSCLTGLTYEIQY